MLDRLTNAEGLDLLRSDKLKYLMFPNLDRAEEVDKEHNNKRSRDSLLTEGILTMAWK